MLSVFTKNKNFIIMLLITLGAQELSAMQRVFQPRVYLSKTGTRSFSRTAPLCHLESGRGICDSESDFFQELREMSKKSIPANTALLKNALLSKNYDLACHALPLFMSRYTPVNNAEIKLLVDIALENGFLDVAKSLLAKGVLTDSPEIQTYKTWKE